MSVHVRSCSSSLLQAISKMEGAPKKRRRGCRGGQQYREPPEPKPKQPAAPKQQAAFPSSL
eukprot:8320171-Karenia_brevis.AAC.1